MFWVSKFIKAKRNEKGHKLSERNGKYNDSTETIKKG